jgi:2-methylcitrate dehydratase PrpD
LSRQSLTENAARLICGFAGTVIPEEAFYRSKIAVMDCVGVALAGSREPVGRIMLEYARGLTGGGEATIWGTAHKVAAVEAALVNGTMSHALDYDDMNRSMLGHPSAVLVPALFAVAEKMHLSGRKLLEGYVIGLEVMARLGRIFGPQAYENSWHPTAIFGVIGACASTSYLLKLSYDQTLNAIGIAASEASGIKKNFGSMTKSLHAGSAARKGMWAAMLAEKGLTADSQALDGTFGFMDMFDGRPYEPEAAGDSDKPLEILEPGLVFKQYPCCGGLHSLLDNILELRQAKGIKPEQVAAIECRVHPHKIAYLDRPLVQAGLEAKFSIQYCVAAALCYGEVGLDHFSQESVARPETQALMKKVRITSGEELGGFGSEVKVRTSDGREFSSALSEPRGSLSSPLTEGELLRKFVDCATMTMSSSRAGKAGEALMAIEAESNLENITKLLDSN